MAMKSASSPRRLYVRAGHPLCLFGGVYFGPSRGKNVKSVIDPKGEVTIKIADGKGGRKRAEVTQVIGENSVTETWLEQSVTFVPRAVPSTEGTPTS